MARGYRGLVLSTNIGASGTSLTPLGSDSANLTRALSKAADIADLAEPANETP